MAKADVPLAPVISLDEHRPHLSGKARCIACGHEEVCVAPLGVTWMECGKCHTDHMTWSAQVERDEPHWHCNCGNNLFYVTPEGWYCPMCGVYHDL